jgi:hypothetical protein
MIVCLLIVDTPNETLPHETFILQPSHLHSMLALMSFLYTHTHTHARGARAYQHFRTIATYAEIEPPLLYRIPVLLSCKKKGGMFV